MEPIQEMKEFEEARNSVQFTVQNVVIDGDFLAGPQRFAVDGEPGVVGEVELGLKVDLANPVFTSDQPPLLARLLVT